MLTCVAVPAVPRTADDEIERLRSRAPTLGLLDIADCTASLAAVALLGGRFDPGALWRNTALLAGIPVLSCGLLRPALSWQPTVLAPLTLDCSARTLIAASAPGVSCWPRRAPDRHRARARGARASGLLASLLVPLISQRA